MCKLGFTDSLTSRQRRRKRYALIKIDAPENVCQNQVRLAHTPIVATSSWRRTVLL